MADETRGGQAWWDQTRFTDATLKTLNTELTTIAAARLHGEKNSSMSTGDLVNEALIRLSAITQIEWKDRPHLLAMASTLMRRILIDHARRRHTDKRQHAKVTLVTGLPQQGPGFEIMALDMALKELREIDVERADIVEMRFFGGMTNTEIGTVLNISEATVKRRWSAARSWLYDTLKSDP